MSKLRVITYANKRVVNLDGLVQNLTLTGDVVKPFRTCEITLINSPDSRRRFLGFELGKDLRVLYDNKEIFRGILFKQGISTNGNQTLTAHDANVYLTNNSDSVVYKNQTATQIISALCGKYGIAIGTLAPTGYVIKSHIVRGKSLFDIMTAALTTTYKSTGKKYRLVSSEGKLNLVDAANNVKSFVAENGVNVLSVAFSESIEDVRTAVKLTGGDDKKPIKAEAKGDTSKYGVMQHFEHYGDVKKSDELQTIAKSLLAELSKPAREFDVTTLGNVEVISGSAIAVYDTLTGIQGAFYVSSDSHSFNGTGEYTMSLKLSRTNDVPQQDPDPPPKPPKPKKAKLTAAEKKARAKQRAEDRKKEKAKKEAKK